MYRKFYLAATRFELLEARAVYEPVVNIFDPNGLVLVPLPERFLPKEEGQLVKVEWGELIDALKETYGEQARRGELEPPSHSASTRATA